MTGLERNSEAVEMAAYAPLLVHEHAYGWPTNLIVFDNYRCVTSIALQALNAQLVNAADC